MNGNPDAVLVANAPLSWTTTLTGLVRGARRVLAADGGANHLARIGHRPEAVIGDMDSIAADTRRWVGEERLLCRPDQERTDLDKALSYAFDELVLEQLVVLAALGGRADHDLGNLGILARRAMAENLVFLGSDHRVLAVEGRLELAAVPGETWSFWTYDPRVRVSLGGVQWPVVREPLDPVGRPSVSNRATGSVVTVESDGGPVIVMRRFRKFADR